jgi:uncharacterized membrane-anchored protein YitT (DUF2179 family)
MYRSLKECIFSILRRFVLSTITDKNFTGHDYVHMSNMADVSLETEATYPLRALGFISSLDGVRVAHFI